MTQECWPFCFFSYLTLHLLIYVEKNFVSFLPYIFVDPSSPLVGNYIR